MAGLNADELAISTASGGSSKWGAGRGRPFKWDQARRLFGRYACPSGPNAAMPEIPSACRMTMPGAAPYASPLSTLLPLTYLKKSLIAIRYRKKNTVVGIQKSV